MIALAKRLVFIAMLAAQHISTQLIRVSYDDTILANGNTYRLGGFAAPANLPSQVRGRALPS